MNVVQSPDYTMVVLDTPVHEGPSLLDSDEFQDIFVTSTTNNDTKQGPQPPYWSLTSRGIYATVLVIFMIASLIGNSLVITVIIKNRGMRTRTNMFLCNLAIVDCLCVLLDMPLSLATIIQGDWIFSEVICQINGFTLPLFFVTSIHTLMYIGVHKYVSIRYPFSQFITKTRIRIMIFAAWLWGVLAGFLTVIGLNRVTYKPLTAQCGPEYPHDPTTYVHIAVIAITCYLIPLFILIVCYLGMFHEIKALSHRLEQNTTMEKQLIYMQQRRITLTLFAVLVLFIVCWTPYIVYSVGVSFIQDKTAIPNHANPLSYWCGYLSSACNPFIYGLMSPAFREGYLELMCSKNGRHIVMDVYGRRRVRPWSYIPYANYYNRDSQMGFGGADNPHRHHFRFRQLLQRHLTGEGDTSSPDSSPISLKSSLTSLANSLLFPKSRALSTSSLPRNFVYTANVQGRFNDHRHQSLLARLSKIITAEKVEEEEMAPMRSPQPVDGGRTPSVTHADITIHVEEVDDVEQSIADEAQEELLANTDIPHTVIVIPDVERSDENSNQTFDDQETFRRCSEPENKARHSLEITSGVSEKTISGSPPSVSEVDLNSRFGKKRDSIFGNVLTVPDPGTRPWLSKSLSDESSQREKFTDIQVDKARSDSCIKNKSTAKGASPRNLFMRLFSSPATSPVHKKKKARKRSGAAAEESSVSFDTSCTDYAPKKYDRSLSEEPGKTHMTQSQKSLLRIPGEKTRHKSEPMLFSEGFFKWKLIKDKYSLKIKNKNKGKDSNSRKSLEDNFIPKFMRSQSSKATVARHPSIEKLDCMNTEYLFSRYSPNRAKRSKSPTTNLTGSKSYHRSVSQEAYSPQNNAVDTEIIAPKDNSHTTRKVICRSISDPYLTFKMVEEKCLQRNYTKHWDRQRKSIRKRSQTVTSEEETVTTAETADNGTTACDVVT